MKVLIFTESDESISRRLWEFSVPMLRQKGIDVHMGTVKSEGELMRLFQKSGIKTHAFNSSRALDYIGISRRLAQLAKTERYDMVHACEAIPALVAGISSVAFSNPARIIFNRQHNILHGKQRFFSFFGSQLADVIMPVSKSSGESAVKYDRISARKICVAYSGVEELRYVDSDEIEQMKRSLGIPPEAAVVSIVAHLREEKGHETLLKACSIVASTIDQPLHLVVVGSGAKELELKEIAASYKSFSTHFVGNKSDVALWFSIGDIVAMPSYHEAFGLSAVEAMSCGKAVVASNVGGLAEIFDQNINGVLVQPGNSTDLASALCGLLDSPDILKKIGSNARLKYLQNFTMEKMVDGWIECYKSALDNNH